MRIIDKNHDFYDYLQDPTDNTLIFDRRGSFLLDKKRICEAMYRINYMRYGRHKDCKHHIIFVSCGAVTWAFLATVTKFDNSYFNSKDEKPEDFTLEFLESWRDYDRENVLINVKVDYCNDNKYDWKTHKWSFDKKNICFGPTSWKNGEDVSSMKTSIQTKKGFEDIEYNIPLLRGIGITNLIDPVEVFCAIEEHFSRLKTASEKTEPLGATNDDKITMHGFDTKTSFRGKN